MDSYPLDIYPQSLGLELGKGSGLVMVRVRVGVPRGVYDRMYVTGGKCRMSGGQCPRTAVVRERVETIFLHCFTPI